MSEQKKFILEEFQEPQPQKLSFLDRITTRKGVKYAVFMGVWLLLAIFGANLSGEIFGIDTNGHNVGAGLSWVASFLLARFMWVYKY